jgi:hypothetical protein
MSVACVIIFVGFYLLRKLLLNYYIHRDDRVHIDDIHTGGVHKEDIVHIIGDTTILIIFMLL